MADRPEDVIEDVEDEYEDDYEEVSAGEEEAGASGVEALDDDDDGGGGGAAAAAAGEEEEGDEDEDEYEEEEEDEEGASAEPSEEEGAGPLATAAAAAAGARAGGPPARRRGGGQGEEAVAARLLRGLKVTASALRPANLLRTASAQFHQVQRVAFRAEDAARFSARLAVRLARRAARPALVALVAHRALRTISQSQLPIYQAARLPRRKQQAYLFERAMGSNWRELMRQDLLDAVAEVDAGLNTEDVNEEKRALQAAIMRRLEVEEWDKERMRHYYYGLYGLGPWYWDMEERLHNPFFVGSRGWNEPIEAWVGRNKVFRRDVAASRRTGDCVTDALKALGENRGAPVPESVGRRIKRRETLTPGDALLTDPSMVAALTAGMRGPDGAPLSGAEAALRAREELELARERLQRQREREEMGH